MGLLLPHKIKIIYFSDVRPLWTLRMVLETIFCFTFLPREDETFTERAHENLLLGSVRPFQFLDENDMDYLPVKGRVYRQPSICRDFRERFF